MISFIVCMSSTSNKGMRFKPLPKEIVRLYRQQMVSMRAAMGSAEEWQDYKNAVRILDPELAAYMDLTSHRDHGTEKSA